MLSLPRLLRARLQIEMMEAMTPYPFGNRTDEGSGFFSFGSEEPITSTIVGEFKGFASGRRYKLANGQTWEQIDGSTLAGVRRTDPAVTIKPGLFNNWFLKIDGYNTQAKVRRIK